VSAKILGRDADPERKIDGYELRVANVKVVADAPEGLR